MLRKQLQPEILKLLRHHDSLAPDNHYERKSIQRKILFLMESVKLDEHELA